MPYYRRRKRTRAGMKKRWRPLRRYRRRYQRRRGSKIGSRRVATGQPDQMRVKFINNIVINGTGGAAVNDYNLTANHKQPGGTLPTPDSQEPLYWDIYSPMYNRYKVHACGIKVTLINTTSASPTYANSNYRIVIFPSTDLEAITDAISMPEQPYAKERFAFLATSVARMKHYMSTRKIFGTQVKDSGFEGTMVSSPSRPWYWKIVVMRLDGGSITAGDYKLEVKLSQYMTLFDREIITDA